MAALMVRTLRKTLDLNGGFGGWKDNKVPNEMVEQYLKYVKGVICELVHFRYCSTILE